MRIRLKESRTVEPTQLVVGLQEMKSWLKIPDSDISDDPIIAGLLKTAELQCEDFTSRMLLTQTWTGYLDFWPMDSSNDDYWEGWRQGPSDVLLNAVRGIDFLRLPIQSITSVSTYDDNDVSTVYSSDNYYLANSGIPHRLILRKGASAPITTRIADGIEIIYVGGYGDNPGDVPQNLRDGILRFVTYAYENRGEALTADQLRSSSGAQMLWDSSRVRRL